MADRINDRIGRFAAVYCCRNDQKYTLESDTAGLSRLFGYSAEELTDRFHSSLLELAEPSFQETFQKAVTGQTASGEEVEIVFPVLHKNGNIVWVMNRACVVSAEDGSEHLEGLLVDITRSKNNYDIEKQKARALQEQAQRDSLTQLYNAQTTREMAEEYLGQGQKVPGCALLIIDLDDFKQVNDFHGHMFGDKVLVQVAETIKKLFRSQDIVGRIGGEEFLVLMKDIVDKKIVNQRCCQMNQAFHEILRKQLQERPLSCSIGVAFAPENGEVYYDLFCHADQALYYAKSLGKDRYAFYDPQCCGLRNISIAGKEAGV